MSYLKPSTCQALDLLGGIWKLVVKWLTMFLSLGWGPLHVKSKLDNLWADANITVSIPFDLFVG